MSIQESNKLTPIKYRIHQWFDMDTLQPVFGIDIKVKEKKGWFHVSDGGEPVFYPTEKEAKIEVKRLNQALRNSQPSNTTP